MEDEALFGASDNLIEETDTDQEELDIYGCVGLLSLY